MRLTVGAERETLNRLVVHDFMNSGPNSYYKSNKISPFRVTHFPYLRCKFRILPST